MRPNLRRSLRIAIAPGLLGAVVAASCQPATQVTLVVDSRVPCAELDGVALFVSADAADAEEEARSGFIAAETRSCDVANGRVGTLVVTPSESSGAVVVVAGVGGTPPSTCRSDNGYFGCIVARRRFAFVERRSMTLPITLDPDCRNVPCDALSTCSRGACVSSEVACDGDRCADIAEPPVAIGSDASAGDAAADATDAAPPPPDGAPLPDGAPDGAVGDGLGCPPYESPVFVCGGASPKCCHSPGHAKAYVCIGPDAPCDDFSWECARDADCPDGLACCLWLEESSTKCEAACVDGRHHVCTTLEDCNGASACDNLVTQLAKVCDYQ